MLKPRVLVCGVEGVGHQALWLVKSYGATVFACDDNPAAQELARNIGVERALSLDELKRSAQQEQFRVDMVFDFLGSEKCEFHSVYGQFALVLTAT